PLWREYAHSGSDLPPAGPERAGVPHRLLSRGPRRHSPRLSPTGAPRRRLTGWRRSRIGASIEDGGKADGHRGSASGQVCSAQATLEGAYPTPLAKDEKLT